MAWGSYWEIVRRRWILIAAVLLLDVLASGYLYAKAHRQAGFQACSTVYVADVSAPSLISAPSATLDTAGQLLAGETAANFFADDVLDVSQSQHVAAFVSRSLQARHLPNTSEGDVNGSVGGSRRDRTVSLCVTNPNQASAVAVDAAVVTAMTADRSRFMGPAIAKRTYVAEISNPSVGPVAEGHNLQNLALRLILGLLVALGLALFWEAIDPTVRNREDVSEALDVPVVRSSR